MAAGAVAGGEHHRRHLAVAGVAAGADAERSLAAFAQPELSRLLQAVAENPAAAGLSLLGFSFVYGVLHALGPGHGKIVITTGLPPIPRN